MPVDTAILLKMRELALKGDQKAGMALISLRRGSSPEAGQGLTAEAMSDEDRAILKLAGFSPGDEGGSDGAA